MREHESFHAKSLNDAVDCPARESGISVGGQRRSHQSDITMLPVMKIGDTGRLGGAGERLADVE